MSVAARAEGAPARQPRRRILFIAANPWLTFVNHDLQILSACHDVDVLSRNEYAGNRRWLPVVARQLMRGRYALVYVWFAEPYDIPYIVFLARLFGARCAIVTGGYDTASVPEIGYGSVLSRAGRLRVKAGLRGAHLLIPFSHFSASEAEHVYPGRPQQVIYPGVDCALFTPAGEKERLAVTVGTISRAVWQRKGLDVFARASRHLPDVRFVIIGRVEDEAVAASLRQAGGENLHLIARRVAESELVGWYQRAAVYAQLSAHEGFGLAVAEAMACGAVPVAADRGSLPEVVGESGFLVPYGDDGAAARAVEEALACGRGAVARQRVEAQFPLARRRQELLAAIDGLLAPTASQEADP